MKNKKSYLSEAFYLFFKKEFKYHFLTPVFYIISVISAIIVFNDLTITSYTASGIIRIGELDHDALFVISKLFGTIGFLLIITLPFFIGKAIHKDIEHNFHGILYTYPFRNSSLLWGRFSGSFAAVLIILLITALSMIVANQSLDAAYTGDHSLSVYLIAYFWIVLPGLLFFCLSIYLVAIKSRQTLTIYLSAVVFFLFFFLIQAFLSDQMRAMNVENGSFFKWLTLLDPFGISLLSYIESGLSTEELNGWTFSDTPFLYIHRLFWMTLCLFLGVFVNNSFSRSFNAEKGGLGAWFKKQIRKDKSDSRMDFIESPKLSPFKPGKLKSAIRLTKYYLKDVTTNIGFLIIILLSISSLHSNFVKNIESSSALPSVSYYINHGLDNADMPFLLLILFFSGYIAWKNKSTEFSALLYAYPGGNNLFIFSKFAAVWFLALIYVAILFFFGWIYQIMSGYTEIEYLHYVEYLLGIKWIAYALIGSGFLFFHLISKNMYIGYGLSIISTILVLVLPSIGLDNPFFQPGSFLEIRYSDMHRMIPVNDINNVLSAYWLTIMALIFFIAHFGFSREITKNNRVHPQNLSKSATAGIGLCVILISIGVTGVTFHNESVTSSNERLMSHLEYEKLYKVHENKPQLYLDSVFVGGSINPEKGKANLEGSYLLVNTTKVPINELHLSLIPVSYVKNQEMNVGAEGVWTLRDSTVGYYIYTLNNSILPGDSLLFEFKNQIEKKRFNYKNPNLKLSSQGFMLDNFPGNLHYFPQIGYKREAEVQSMELRENAGLNPNADTEIPLSEADNIESITRSMIKYSADIRVPEGYTLVSNGELVSKNSDSEGMRFLYESGGYINGHIALIAGIYERYEFFENGITLNIYASPEHTRNIGSIKEGLSDSYRFNSMYFGELPFDHINIVEMPDYGTFGGTAISKPALMLWNEHGGFLTATDKQQLNRVYSTAAHEMAHQWWAHLLRPKSFVEGQQFLTESIAQYIRLKVLQEKYDSTVVTSFIEEEAYFYRYGSSSTTEPQDPIFKSSAGHVIYNKGTLVFNQIEQEIGEDRLLKILGAFYQRYASTAETPISTDLIDYFREELESERFSVVEKIITSVEWEY